MKLSKAQESKMRQHHLRWAIGVFHAQNDEKLLGKAEYERRKQQIPTLGIVPFREAYIDATIEAQDLVDAIEDHDCWDKRSGLDQAVAKWRGKDE